MTDLYDPFDVDALRAAPPSEAITETVLLSVAVHKPNRNEFIRVHPKPEFRIDTTTLEFDSGEGRETFLVPPQMRGHVPSEMLLSVRLLSAITRRNTVFIWPARLPSADRNSGRAWHETGLQCSQMAEDHWIRVVGNRQAGCYEAVRAVGDLPDPVWPDDLDFQALLRLAFRESVITSPDHPVLKALRGEI